MKIKTTVINILMIVLLSFIKSDAQTIKKIIIDEKDIFSGYYLVVEPQNMDSISGALVLLAGFGQIPEDSPPETKIHTTAYSNNILTLFIAGGNKLYADSITTTKITKIIEDVLARYKVNKNTFVFGGFSAGGMIAMRYVELCYEFPDRFPIQPKGIFTVDSPIDIFTIYEQLEDSKENKYSELAVEEAVRAIKHINDDYGIPRENISTYGKLTAFSMNKEYGQNEKYLKNIAVRTYHDVDIAWRIKNRNQTVHRSNYEVTAELINRLVLMGNTKAEFIQTFQTGYRSNGQRHPHSWSIVDPVDLIQWAKGLFE
ncbi:MAG: hypothetical protein IPJ86_11350 [Bacteroidetes bacterium]|nr:hypothetical protein [Bacteroidota bacterium]MBK9320337.1 hypothetical protein [Bacteroidota bacterium]